MLTIRRHFLFFPVFACLALLATLALLACQDAQPPDKTAQADQQPNIILIMADDLGYSDVGAFGSEIKTPAIDRLAFEGVRLTGFYTSTKCNPTRAMLMSGVDNNLSGLGATRDAYHLNPAMTTLPASLKQAGYYTFLSGKWDAGIDEGLRPAERGFDKAFSLLWDSGSHYGAASASARRPNIFSRNGVLIAEPQDHYMTQLLTDEFLTLLDAAEADGRPFFGMLSYTAPHWLLQVDDAYRDRYDGVYDVGWHVIRENRLKKQAAMGLLPDNKTAAQGDHVEDWDMLDAERKKYETRRMQIYAGMISYMDEQIGRVMAALEAKDLLDNTIIIFISDNGADGEGLEAIPFVLDYGDGSFDNSYDNIGKIGSYLRLEANWAFVATAPFARFKGFGYEGGIAAPMIIRFPDGRRAGQIDDGLIHVIDFFPTFLELAGMDKRTWPAQLQGISRYAFIRTGADDAPERALGWYYPLDGNKGRAIRQGDWKLVWHKEDERVSLFNVKTDRGETIDVSERYPAIKEKLLTLWDAYATRNNITNIR